MRVSIQYSIELDNIPSEMQTLVDTTVVEALDVIGSTLRDLFYNDNPEHALTTIDEARQALLAVDERLSDVDGILRGYIVQRAALVQDSIEQPTPEGAPVQAETSEAAMMPASQDTMKMVQATLAAHRAETDALRRTMNLGFGGADDDEGQDDDD